MIGSRPILVLGYGNPSRGDDALGPMFVERLDEEQDAGRLPPNFDTLTDFQLQIEHALDLQGRAVVLFVDAAADLDAAHILRPLTPARDESYSTHAISPGAVLAVYEQVCAGPLPPAFLLGLKGISFELGQGLSETAREALEQGLAAIRPLLAQADPAAWRAALHSAPHPPQPC